MAITSTVLDGQNIVLTLPEAGAVDLFTFNRAAGRVTSAYFPEKWLEPLAKTAGKLADAVGPTTFGTTYALLRLLALGTLDGSPLTASVAINGASYTLRIESLQATSFVVTLPHSLSGGYAAGQTTTLSSGGTYTVATVADLGITEWDGSIADDVVVGKLVAVHHGTGQLVLADNMDASRVPCVGAYALSSGGVYGIRSNGGVNVPGTYGVGQEIYLGREGMATDVPPSEEAAFSQFIGISLSTTKITITIGEVIDV